MAFTRKALKAMSLSDEQIENIIDLHSEVVEALKNQIDTAQKDADKLKDVQKELDELKAKGGDDYKAKYEKEHSDFESYKKSVIEKETATQKANAVKAYFEAKGIKGANLEIAMRGAKEEIDGAELDGDKLKDTSKLDALIAGTYKALVITTSQRGQDVNTPPLGGSGGEIKNRAEIYKKDDHGRYVLNTAERQKALAELMASEKGQ